MGLVSAPMLCAVASGDTAAEDAWVRQDYRDGIHSRSRAARRFKAKARRAARRAEVRTWRLEITVESID